MSQAPPTYPALYQVNTRVWLTERSRTLGRPATLDDIPDADLDGIAGMGFDWIWLLSVWRTGAAGQQASRENPGWRKEFQETLPDLREEDIAGSGFAITGYTVHPSLGGDPGGEMCCHISRRHGRACPWPPPGVPQVSGARYRACASAATRFPRAVQCSSRVL